MFELCFYVLNGIYIYRDLEDVLHCSCSTGLKNERYNFVLLIATQINKPRYILLLQKLFANTSMQCKIQISLDFVKLKEESVSCHSSEKQMFLTEVGL